MWQISFSKSRTSLWPSVMVLARSELAPITTAVEGHTYSITLDVSTQHTYMVVVVVMMVVMMVVMVVMVTML